MLGTEAVVPHPERSCHEVGSIERLVKDKRLTDLARAVEKVFALIGGLSLWLDPEALAG